MAGLINYYKKSFPYLSHDEAKLLSEFSEKVSFKTGETILQIGKYEPYFYFILSGYLRGYNYTDVGEEYNLFFSYPDQMVISPDRFFSDDTKLNTFGFEAISPVVALKLNYERLMELSSSNPGIFRFYNKAVRNLTEILYQRIRLLLIENAEERYLHLKKTKPNIVQLAKKRQLAQFLGITPNSLSRILRKFKDS